MAVPAKCCSTWAAAPSRRASRCPAAARTRSRSRRRTSTATATSTCCLGTWAVPAKCCSTRAMAPSRRASRCPAATRTRARSRRRTSTATATSTCCLGTWAVPANQVLLNAGDSTFPTNITLPGGGAYTPTFSIAAADVDGDGDLDVLLGNYGSPSQVLLNAGDGTFPTNITLPGGGADTYTNSIAAADVDGDGDLDVLLGNLDTPSRVLLNAGGGSFPTSIELPGGSAPTSSIVAADVDGDGDLDVLLGNWGSPSQVLLNVGGGTFPTSITLPGGGANTFSIAAADVDGDGDLDVLLGNSQSPSRVLPFIRCSERGTARSRYGNGCVRCPTPSTRRDDMIDVCYECDEHTQLDASGACVACTEGSERVLG
ncbi:hypothetical protein Ctob_016414, partial [Chrysochromulina tobinii]